MTAAVPPAPRSWRRWLTRGFVVRALIAFLVLNVVALGTSSWYYSEQVKSNLDIVPGSPTFPFTVASVDGATGSLTVRPVTDAVGLESQRQWLASPIVLGLYWAGGMAQTLSPSAATPSGEGKLTVVAKLLGGAWPTPGTRLGVDTAAFPRSTDAPWQTVTFDGPTGTLAAAFQPGAATPASRGAALWVIGVHGLSGDPDELGRLAASTTAYGLPMLSIHYRGDAGMPPEPNGRASFGVSEWPDLEAAVAYAGAHGATGVVLAGQSMGGAIVASYLRHAKDTSLVRAVILDAPALDFSGTVQWEADEDAMPAGLSLPAPVTWSGLLVSSWRYGIDWSAADYVTDPSWCTVPTLLIHGDADVSVPVTMSREFAAKRANVTYEEFKGAGHLTAWNHDPARFDQVVTEFLGKNIFTD